MKIVNPKYKIEVFRCNQTGSYYHSDVNNPYYYIENKTTGGVYILDIINNYDNLIPFEILFGKKTIKKIPNDLFLNLYDLVEMRMSYYQGHKSGLGVKNSITFENFLKTLK